MSGFYRVDVSTYPHTYDNPTGRCDECQTRGAVMRQASDQQMNHVLLLPPVILFLAIAKHCDIDTGNACEGVQSTFSRFTFETNSVDFDNTLLDFNPVILEENEPWNVSHF